MSRIVRYFSETNLGNGHRGLSKIANKEGIDLKNLPQGEFVLFVNKRQSAFKLVTQNNILLHYKNPNPGRINPGIFALVPKYFNGKTFDYSGALRETIYKDFKWAKPMNPAQTLRSMGPGVTI